MYIYTHILFQGPIANAGNFERDFETQNSLFFSTNKVEVFNWVNECCVFRHPREKCIANIRWKFSYVNYMGRVYVIYLVGRVCLRSTLEKVMIIYTQYVHMTVT